MVDVQDFGNYETAWCPGCGNFSLLKAVKQALAGSGLKPADLLFVSGIGQAAKAPHYMNVNLFNGLHGRALPVATAAKCANPQLIVIVESGDGCNYGEGGNHFLAAIRRNPDLTLLAHNNQVYGLTKGQASPTSDPGFVTKAQPHGMPGSPFNPLAVAIAMQAGFVARGFVGEIEHLADIIEQAIAHPGFAIVDILQPCVSFNNVNTFQFYRDRAEKIEDHDPMDWEAAMRLSMEWEDRIPIGIYYKNDRPAFMDNFSYLEDGPLGRRKTDKKKLSEILKDFI